MMSYYTLGVDPAKEKFTICLLTPQGVAMLGPADFEASRSGYEDLVARLADCVGTDRLVVGVEASCALDDNLLALFESVRSRLKLTVIRVEAAQVRRFSGPKPVRGKCDRADARRIAHFTRFYADQLARFIGDPELLAMQRLVNERLALAEDLAAQKNRLRDRLVISFPEFTSVFDDPYCGTGLALLRRAPTAAHLAKKPLATLAGIRAQTPRAQAVGQQRATQLLELARTSIASATTDDDAATIVRLVERIQLLNQQIDAVEKRLAQFVTSIRHNPATEPDHTGSNDPLGAHVPTPAATSSIPTQIQLACTIPGLALVSASAIVLRSGGIGRFTHAKAMAAQLGTCPDKNQTGSSINTAHLTYRGDRRARVLLYLAALAACRSDIGFAFHKWRHVQAGKTPKQATCACMNRMIRIIWHLVHTNTTYDPDRLIRNAQKHHPDMWKSFLANNQELGKTIRKKLEQIPTEVRM